MKVSCTNCQAENNSDAKYCSMCGYTLPMVANENNKEIVQEPITKEAKKKHLISTFIGITTGVSFSLYFTNNFFNPSIDSKLVDFSNEFNRHGPMAIN